LATPWNVRELLLDTGHTAAFQLRQWDDALDLNAAIAVSLRDRNAPAADVARNQFNDYAPLLRLGRTDQALALLQDCLQAFRDVGDTRMIGKALTGLADTEDERGHNDAAIRLELDALRHHYLAGDVISVVIGYHNLGNYLTRRAFHLALASHLAAALVQVLVGINDDDQSIGAAGDDLRELGTSAISPTSVAELDGQLGDIPGTDLPGLIRQICPDAETAEQALRDLVAQAQELAAVPTSDEQ
jgi:hypothetical protein